MMISKIELPYLVLERGDHDGRHRLRIPFENDLQRLAITVIVDNETVQQFGTDYVLDGVLELVMVQLYVHSDRADGHFLELTVRMSRLNLIQHLHHVVTVNIGLVYGASF